MNRFRENIVVLRGIALFFVITAVSYLIGIAIAFGNKRKVTHAHVDRLTGRTLTNGHPYSLFGPLVGCAAIAITLGLVAVCIMFFVVTKED